MSHSFDWFAGEKRWNRTKKNTIALQARSMSVLRHEHAGFRDHNLNTHFFLTVKNVIIYYSAQIRGSRLVRDLGLGFSSFFCFPCRFLFPFLVWSGAGQKMSRCSTFTFQSTHPLPPPLLLLFHGFVIVLLLLLLLSSPKGRPRHPGSVSVLFPADLG